MGFKVGRACPVVFYFKERDLRAYICGDNFVVSGQPNDLQWTRKGLDQKYELTGEVIGPDGGQNKEVRVINRILRWTPEGLSTKLTHAARKSCPPSWLLGKEVGLARSFRN